MFSFTVIHSFIIASTYTDWSIHQDTRVTLYKLFNNELDIHEIEQPRQTYQKHKTFFNIRYREDLHIEFAPVELNTVQFAVDLWYSIICIQWPIHHIL